MSRMGRLVIAFACVLVAMPAFASGVFADRLYSAQPIFTNCANTTDTKTIQWGLGRANLGVSYANGAKVRFKILFVEQPANGIMTAELTDSVIKLPTNWKSRPTDYVSTDKITIKITFFAGAAFTDGGRIRLVANGNLESVDVPTLVSCTSTASSRPAPMTRAPQSAAPVPHPDANLLPATKLSATDDYFFMIDPNMGGPNRMEMDLLLNDVGPKPGKTKIVSVTQMKAPANGSWSGGTPLTQLGTVAIINNGKQVRWTDDRCATTNGLCYNLPGLFFDYTVSDGTSKSTGRAWIKFDIPFLIPLNFEASTFVVTPAIRNQVTAGDTFAILDASPIAIGDLTGVNLSLATRCTSGGGVTLCKFNAEWIISSEGGLQDELKPKPLLCVDVDCELAVGSVVKIQTPIVVNGGYIVPGAMAFPREVGAGETVCNQEYIVQGHPISVPTECVSDLPGAPVTVGDGPVHQTHVAYMFDIGAGDIPASAAQWTQFCRAQSGIHRSPGIPTDYTWKEPCRPYLTSNEFALIWGS
jgi:hypothetical protein